MPASSSLTSSRCLPSVTEEQPELELESIPSITPASTFAPTPPSSSTFLPSPVSMRSAMNSQPEIESALVSESAIPPSIDHVPEIASAPGLPLPPTLLSASKACSEVSTSLSSPTKLLPPETPTSIPAHSSRPLRSSSGDSSDAVVELVVVPVSLISSSLSLSQGESIPSLPTSFEAPLIAHISPRSTPPRLPEIKTIESVSTPLKVAPAPASPTALPITQLLKWQEHPPVCEAPSTLVLCLSHPTSPLLPSSLTHCDFAFALVTTAVLVSTLLDILATTSTLVHKYWSKYEDFGNNQNGNPKTSKPCNIPAQRLRLGQLTPRAPRFVFDPGGLPIPVPTDNLTVFDPRVVVFVLEPAHWHEDSATLDEDARSSLTGDGQDFDPPGGVTVAQPLSLKPLVFGHSIASATWPFVYTSFLFYISLSIPFLP
ncbi:hypothetical protein EDB83DRAFT_2310864 [Lactarius deliciosus]|nr:hypothetical protein EDB83DRAFT_2310864 [Lactarius deliciosus]